MKNLQRVLKLENWRMNFPNCALNFQKQCQFLHLLLQEKHVVLDMVLLIDVGRVQNW
jgi:hypothetical protein